MRIAANTGRASAVVVAALITAPLPAGAAVVNLVSENFSDAAVGPTPPAANWVHSSGGHEAGSGTGFATARGVAPTYDNDNDAGTANVDVPGGYELNNNGGNQTLTVSVTMPGSFDAAPNNFATLSFWAAVRANNAAGASVRVTDVTDGVDAVPATTPAFAPTNTNWQYNSFTFPLLASYAGDTFNVVFAGGGSNGADGLELTDIKFAVNTVPEPASLGLLAVAAVGGLARRRRRA